MKKLILFIFAVCLLDLSSQVLSNTIYQNPSNRTTNLLFHQGNSYFISQRNSNSFADYIYLYSYNSQGSLRFAKAINRGDDSFFGKIFVTNDGKIAFINWQDGCDYGNPSGYLTKFDTNGTVLLDKRYPYFLNDVCQLANGSDYYISNGTYILKVDASGNLLDSTHTLGTIASIARFGTNLLLANVVTNAANPPAHFILSPSLVIQQTLTANSTYYNFLSYNGYYYARTSSGHIDKLDQQLQLVASTSTVPYYSDNKIADFTISNDTIYAVGTSVSPGMKSFYLRMRSDLTGSQISGNNMRRHFPNSICVRGDTVHILANNSGDSPGFQTNKYISYTTLKKNAQYSFNHDVKIKRAWIDGASKSQFRFRVVVVNNGQPVINSFVVNHTYSGWLMSCNRTVTQKRVTTASLFHGDSAEVLTDFIGIYPQPYNTGHGTKECVYLTAPNDMNDMFTDNDGLCSLFDPVSLNEMSVYNRITVYPNPVNDMIHLELNELNQEKDINLQIVDLLGNVDLKFKIASGNQSPEISVSELKTGIYFLQLFSSGGVIATQKMIKE